jgi:hypothetical protein
MSVNNIWISFPSPFFCNNVQSQTWLFSVYYICMSQLVIFCKKRCALSCFRCKLQIKVIPNVCKLHIVSWWKWLSAKSDFALVYPQFSLVIPVQDTFCRILTFKLVFWLGMQGV